MKLKNMAIRASAILIVGLLGAPLARTDDPQSVAAAAKEKPATKAKRVYTDDDLPATRVGIAASDSSTSTAEDAKSSDDEKETKKDAEKPSNKSELQKQLDSVKYDKEMLEKKLARLRNLADQEQSPFRKKMYEDAIVNQQATLAEFDKQMKDLESKLAEKEKVKK